MVLTKCKRAFLTYVLVLYMGISSTLFVDVAGADGGKCLGNCMNGHGMMVYLDKSSYTGEWKDGKHHGKGTLLYPDGRKHVGTFKNGELHGKAIVTLPDGRTMESQCRYGKQISTTFDNGDTFTGEWRDGKFTGKGTVNLPNGDTYSGEFKDSKYHGYGKMTYIDGTKYIGEFKNGKFNGKGAITFPDGTVIESEWEDGHPVK